MSEREWLIASRIGRTLCLPTVDDLIADTLGKWCSRCQRVTEPYLGENNEWPCCDGCWRLYE